MSCWPWQFTNLQWQTLDKKSHQHPYHLRSIYKKIFMFRYAKTRNWTFTSIKVLYYLIICMAKIKAQNLVSNLQYIWFVNELILWPLLPCRGVVTLFWHEKRETVEHIYIMALRATSIIGTRCHFETKCFFWALQLLNQAGTEPGLKNGLG